MSKTPIFSSRPAEPANDPTFMTEGVQRTAVILNERTTCGAKECSVLCTKEHPLIGCLGTNAKTI